MSSMEGHDTTASTKDEPSSQGERERSETSNAPSDDESGKPTIDEPTGPALDPGPDEFDKQAEDD